MTDANLPDHDVHIEVDDDTDTHGFFYPITTPAPTAWEPPPELLAAEAIAAGIDLEPFVDDITVIALNRIADGIERLIGTVERILSDRT